jgi:hypothetical protein
METDPEIEIINKRPWLPLGKAITIASSVVVAAWLVSGALHDLNNTLADLRRDRWTATDMNRYTVLLERANKGLPLIVPDVQEVRAVNRSLESR